MKGVFKHTQDVKESVYQCNLEKKGQFTAAQIITGRS